MFCRVFYYIQKSFIVIPLRINCTSVNYFFLNANDFSDKKNAFLVIISIFQTICYFIEKKSCS